MIVYQALIMPPVGHPRHGVNAYANAMRSPWLPTWTSGNSADFRIFIYIHTIIIHIAIYVYTYIIHKTYLNIFQQSSPRHITKSWPKLPINVISHRQGIGNLQGPTTLQPPFGVIYPGPLKDMGPPKMVSGTHTIP